MNNTRVLNNTRKMESSNAHEFQKYDNQYYKNNVINYEKDTNEAQQPTSIPTWKVPLSKSFSSAAARHNYHLNSDEYSSSGDGFSSNEENKFRFPPSGTSMLRESSREDQASDDDSRPTPEPTSVIQILLPCIICNRTFSPEALERHSKICTRVNVNDARIKHPRGQFDSAKYRIKDTRLELFIPPPSESDETSPGAYQLSAGDNDWAFSRNGRGRSSFQDRTASTRSSFGKGGGGAGSGVAGIPAWRRHIRAASVPKNSDNYGEVFDDGASSINMDNDYTQPSYSRALSPSEDCPYCGRSFGMKAFDRHVNYCKELWERKQYEIQPTTKEIEIARLRQEVRTKYKPMKGSNSWSSLRSFTSNASKDFATNALNKLFGGLKRVENINLHGNKPGGGVGLTGFKKSNESLASVSSYGDFSRSNKRHRNPSSPSMMNSRGNPPPPNIMSTSLNVPRPGTLQRSISNIPQYNRSHKSSENLAARPTTPVSSSGYGQGGSYMNGFSRNSKNRSSLNKNYFFRNANKRVEPEGTEHVDANNYMNTNHAVENYNRFYGPSGGDRAGIGGRDYKESSKVTAAPPLIITPMNYYTKSSPSPSSTSSQSSRTPYNATVAPLRQNNNNSNGNYGNHHPESESNPNKANGLGQSSSLFTKSMTESSENSRAPYDPYEKAKQLEEFFRKQPPPAHNRRVQRKIGLDRAFASVCGSSESGSTEDSKQQQRDYSQSPATATQVLQITEDEQQQQLPPLYTDFDLNSTENSYYWDELLNKKPASRSGGGGAPESKSLFNRSSGSNDTSNLNGGGPYPDSSALLSRRTSGQLNPLSTTNNKSTRPSNTSSADSAFSRSDGTDLEFEALESLFELGQLPSSSTLTTLPTITTTNNHNSPSTTSNDVRMNPGTMIAKESADPRSSGRNRLRTDSSAEDEPMAISSSSSSSSSTSHQHMMGGSSSEPANSFDDDGRIGQEIIHKITITPSTTPTSTNHHHHQHQLQPMLAKFCHECGTSYPNRDAKFCPECGERRVIHV